MVFKRVPHRLALLLQYNVGEKPTAILYTYISVVHWCSKKNRTHVDLLSIPQLESHHEKIHIVKYTYIS